MYAKVFLIEKLSIFNQNQNVQQFKILEHLNTEKTTVWFTSENQNFIDQTDL